MPEYYGPAFGPQGQQFTNPNVLDYNNTISQYKQTGNASPVNNVLSSFNQLPGNQAYNAPNVPNQSVLGASTGPGDSQLTQLQNMAKTTGGLNPVQQTQLQQLLSQQQGAASSGNDALLSSLNTQYDQNAQDLQSQLGYLGNQKDQSLNTLNTDFQGVQNQIGTQKQQAQTNLDDQIAQAGSQAKNTQNANRNTLRALGILNSSAAGETLSKPLTAFDQQRAQLVQQTNQRVAQLDDFLNQKVSEHQNAVQSLESQYQNLVGNIQRDLRFNDRQRADAVKNANAALQQRMAEIQSSFFNYQTQVQTAKQNAAMQLAQIQAQGNASYDPQAILSTIFGGDQAQTPQSVGIAQDQKKNTLSGQ